MKEASGFSVRLGRDRLQVMNLDRLPIMRYRWEEPRHSNAEWELHIVLEGTCRVDLEEKQCNLSRGQALLIPPGQYHRPRTGADTFERFSVAFVIFPGMLKEQLQNRCCDGVVFTLGETVLQQAKEIYREQMGRNPFRQSCLEAMVTQLLVGVFRALGLTEGASGDYRTDDSGITKIVDTYFEQHFADTAGEQALADRLHISRRQLVRVLKKHYGMTFREKLIHTRMDYAAWQLRTTQLPVGRICEMVGYSSEAAFFKTFRQYFGMTPSDYRTTRNVKDI